VDDQSAEGGDWGALITDLMGVLAPRELLAIHTNLPGAVPNVLTRRLLPVRGPHPVSELTRLASRQRGRLHPGFRRFGRPRRHRISLQGQLGNLHWQDSHLLDHQLSFTALSRRTNVAMALTVPPNLSWVDLNSYPR
jgi:hypothetical protein